MNSSHGNPSGASFRSADHVDDVAGGAVLNGIAESVSRLTNLLEAKRIGQQGRRALVSVFRECDVVEAPNGMFGRHRASLPNSVWFRMGGNQFKLQTVRISEEQQVLSEVRPCIVEFNSAFAETLSPIGQGFFGHGKGRNRQLPRADPSPPCIRPREKRHNRPGMSQAISVVQVISSRIIEIYG